MLLLVNQKILETCIEKLNICFEIEQEIQIKNFAFEYTKNNNFFITQTENPSPQNAIIIQLNDDNMWQIDKFQSPYTFKKSCVHIDDGVLSVHEGQAEQNCIVAYFERIDHCTTCDNVGRTVEEIAQYIDEKHQMNMCDIYLLIPGKREFDDEGHFYCDRCHCDDELFATFKENIDYCVEREYNSDFAKQVTRKNFGKIKVRIPEYAYDNDYTQDAMIGIMQHETGYCVLQVYIYSCYIGGNKLLQYYCGQELEYGIDGQWMEIEQLCEYFGVKRYGQKRSMVFAYGHVDDVEIINALANEELPMGKISGDFQKKLDNDNVAQYDTAKVYVSAVTMIEVCKDITTFVDTRVAYHAIEIFFVELLMLQDAAIDKVYRDLRSNKFADNMESIDAMADKYEQISFDMAQAVEFANYEQFNYPTVRLSAKKVAKNFGIEYVFEKYESNKELLSSLIQANRRKLEAHQEKVKNYFLFLLSAVATIGTIGQMIHAIMQDARGGTQSYAAALAVVCSFYFMYRFLVLIGRIKKRKK